MKVGKIAVIEALWFSDGLLQSSPIKRLRSQTRSYLRHDMYNSNTSVFGIHMNYQSTHWSIAENNRFSGVSVENHEWANSIVP